MSTVLVRASVVAACCGRVVRLSLPADDLPDRYRLHLDVLHTALGLHARSCPEA